MNSLAEFVKQRRKKVGLTQEEFALKAGVAEVSGAQFPQLNVGER